MLLLFLQFAARHGIDPALVKGMTARYASQSEPATAERPVARERFLGGTMLDVYARMGDPIG